MEIEELAVSEVEEEKDDGKTVATKSFVKPVKRLVIVQTNAGTVLSKISLLKILNQGSNNNIISLFPNQDFIPALLPTKCRIEGALILLPHFILPLNTTLMEVLHQLAIRISGATNHITNDVSNFTNSSEYHGGRTLQLGNGLGVKIAHIGHSQFRSPSSSLHCKPLFLINLLHVPEIIKNLLSVSQFAKDNSVYFEFRAHVCFVKDQVTKDTILKGIRDHGLYHFILHKSTTHLPKSSNTPSSISSPKNNSNLPALCSVSLGSSFPTAFSTSSNVVPSIDI